MLGSAASAGTANWSAAGHSDGRAAGTERPTWATVGSGSGTAATTTGLTAGGGAAGDGADRSPGTSTDDCRITSRSGIDGPHAPTSATAASAAKDERRLIIESPQLAAVGW